MKKFIFLFFLLVTSFSFSQTKKYIPMYKPKSPITKNLGDTTILLPNTKFYITDIKTGKKELYSFGDTILIYQNTIIGIKMVKY
jgi:hypothetical protein